MGTLENLPDIVSIKELSDYLGVSAMTIWRAINEGKLKAYKYGRQFRIEKVDILKWREEA